MVRRLAAIAILATLAAVGCRAAGSGGLAANPQPIVPRPRLTAETVVARINHNAGQVQSLKAEPEITVISETQKGGVSGRLAMDREKKFRLVIRGGMQNVADLGANDEEFWFWLRDNEPKEYYVCSYDEAGDVPLEGALQPDWIVEALGLREISTEEAAGIQIARGEGPHAGTWILTQRRKASSGNVYTKVMIVEATHGLIRELQLRGADNTLLSRAVVEPVKGRDTYQKIALVAPKADGSGGEYVYLPNRIRLEWIKEKLALEVNVGRPEINKPIDPALFEEPKFAGYARHVLPEDNGLNSGTTTVRETRPAPPTGSTVRLGQPEPAPSSTLDRTTRNLGDPQPLTADLGLARADARIPEPVIGARLPSAPVPEALRSTGVGSWGRATPRIVEP